MRVEPSFSKKGESKKPTPWKINMAPIAITHLDRKMIFQTPMIMFQPLIFQDVAFFGGVVYQVILEHFHIL